MSQKYTIKHVNCILVHIYMGNIQKKIDFVYIVRKLVVWDVNFYGSQNKFA